MENKKLIIVLNYEIKNKFYFFKKRLFLIKYYKRNYYRLKFKIIKKLKKQRERILRIFFGKVIIRKKRYISKKSLYYYTKKIQSLSKICIYNLNIQKKFIKKKLPSVFSCKLSFKKNNTFLTLYNKQKILFTISMGMSEDLMLKKKINKKDKSTLENFTNITNKLFLKCKQIGIHLLILNIEFSKKSKKYLINSFLFFLRKYKIYLLGVNCHLQLAHNGLRKKKLKRK